MIENILSLLEFSINSGNLANVSENSFWQLFNNYQTQINQYKQKHNRIPIVFLIEKEIDRFLPAFFASVINQACLFLINPDWKKYEWQQIEQIVIADLIFGKLEYQFSLNEDKNNSPSFTGIMIPTGGTSGKIKFAIHTWQTLTASAQGFYHFFGQIPLNFYSCLPLYHVSGLLPIIRSLLSQGKLIVTSFQELKNNLLINDNYQDYFISFVPTQLQFFLDKNPLLLTKFKTILVGGAAIHLQQIILAQKYKIPIALTYGMTETASGISLLKSEKLSTNNYSSGEILPHAQVLITSECEGEGIIKIKSKSLFQGYYPQRQINQIFITDDIGYFDKQQNLHVLGRKSHVIITGGENVYPLEVEKAIFQTQLVEDVYVTGENDRYWGQIIIAFYTPKNDLITIEQIKSKLNETISKHKIPKKWYPIKKIPRNKQGKIILKSNY